MAKKSKKINKTKLETKKNAKSSKTKSTEPKIDVRASFYAKQLEAVEKDLGMVSNSIIESERISSGVLQIDWIFGGGFVPGIVSIAGEEGSAKTTVCYHTMANAISNLKLPYTGFYDAEGAISPKYSGAILQPFGLDVKELLSKKGREHGFHYFRDQVIERMFDYLKQTLKLMPDKNWNSEANAWCYHFPKRSDYFKKLMEAMEIKPSKALSTGAFYISPTENSGPEGLFLVDSYASLLTREEEDKSDTEGGGRSAMEAAAFAKHLKRVKVDLAEKKVAMIGTNHLGSHVRQQYGGPDDQQYEKMGNALKYFSDARARAYSRAGSAAKKFGPFDYDKNNSKFGIEPSVEANGDDRYAIKEFKNVKNKFGNPGLKTTIRVWVSDAYGKPRGIDPVFDVYMHLRNTDQIKKAVKGKGFKFNLKKSVGKKRSEALNNIKTFSFMTLKRLVIAEYTDNKDLLRKAVKELGIDFKPNLRVSLFTQLKNDESLYSSIRESAKTESEEIEEDDVDYEEI